jgi:hypothetical protein
MARVRHSKSTHFDPTRQLGREQKPVIATEFRRRGVGNIAEQEPHRAAADTGERRSQTGCRSLGTGLSGEARHRCSPYELCSQRNIAGFELSSRARTRAAQNYFSAAAMAALAKTVAVSISSA